MGSTLASAYTHKQDTVTQLTFLYARKSQSFLSLNKFFCFYFFCSFYIFLSSSGTGIQYVHALCVTVGQRKEAKAKFINIQFR
jgi:hypothetical protein